MGEQENAFAGIFRNDTSMRVVLDTNVCLDLFVFCDVRCNGLMQMLKTGIVTAVTRNDCHDEWQHVLSSPLLSLDAITRQNCAAAYNRMISCRDFERKNYARLPVCKDRDDQKFLELAYDAEAKFLITKDKALLKLSGKTGKTVFFRIINPEQAYRIISSDQTDCAK